MFKNRKRVNCNMHRSTLPLASFGGQKFNNTQTNATILDQHRRDLQRSRRRWRSPAATTLDRRSSGVNEEMARVPKARRAGDQREMGRVKDGGEEGVYMSVGDQGTLIRLLWFLIRTPID
jgi:hypothetical protein